MIKLGRILSAVAMVVIPWLSAIAADDTPASLRLPLDLPPLLAGNFGELRPNHFHSGVDFKTNGRTGYDIHSAADGYVSRVIVSPWGFGRAVYIVHPELGLTTVYGHLSAFCPDIDKRVRNEQYSRQTFDIDLEFAPGDIPVNKGDVIAKSGNAGSSFGPHLHMDVRDTRTGDALDPLRWYGKYFNDKLSPQVNRIALYPVGKKGIVSGIKTLKPEKFAQGFTAWGDVCPAIEAFDKMNGTANIYGVKYLTLSVDGNVVYRRTIDRFSFDSTKAVNTLANYHSVVSSGRWMMHTYVPPSAPLGDMINSVNGGVVRIDREREYKFVFTLTDHFGNTTTVPFSVYGKKMAVPVGKPKGFVLNYDGSHSYDVDGLKVVIPKGALYDDMEFNVSRRAERRYLSDVFSIGDEGVPVATHIDIEIPLKYDTVQQKNRYVPVRINAKGTPVAVDGEYKDGKIRASVNRFGKYAVALDTVSPRIVPVNIRNWSKSGTVRIKISDNLAGVAHYRGEIDGKFALFELDGKSATAMFRMDSSRFSRGRTHKLVFVAADAAGNRSTYKTTFRW